MSASAVSTESENNNVMSECVKNTQDYNLASQCYNEWKIAEEQRNYQNLQEFLQLNPWYRGNRWQWQNNLEYRCERVYNNNVMTTMIICSKPIYLN